MKFIWRISIGIFFFSIIFSPTHAAFIDIQSHKYQQAIEFLEELGMIKGYADGTFRPEALMTRAEVVTILISNRYQDIESKNCFTDVRSAEWYSRYACKAQELGITSGYPNGSFQPSRTVSFVEALLMLQRAYKVPVEIASGPTWFEPSVRSASAMNIIPLDVDSFGMPFTRGQMADMLTRFLKLEDGKLDEYLGYYQKFVVMTYESISSMQDYRAYWKKADYFTGPNSEGIDYPNTDGGEATARAFLEDFKEFYGLADSQKDLVLAETINNFYYFEQQYKGISICWGQMEVGINGKTMTSARGRLLPNLTMDVIPAITASKAEKIAIERLGNANVFIDEFHPTKLMIFNEGIFEGSRGYKKYPTRLAWPINLKDERGNFLVELVVDAENGSIFSASPVASCAINRGPP